MLSRRYVLDRDSLIFLCRFLVHLFTILSTALGVELALSDGEIESEDMPIILGALGVMLLYVLKALNAPDD